jgi:activating signal cointegrator 1
MKTRENNILKTLTICQPHAHSICLPGHHPDAKRVENRIWRTSFRGQIGIHAGKSRSWLDRDPDRPGYDLSGFKISDMHFGAIVAIADLVDCIEVNSGVDGSGRFGPIPVKPLPKGFEWVLTHAHTEGPFAWILQNVRVLAEPIPKSGAQGLWFWTPPKKPLEFVAPDAMPPLTAVSVPGQRLGICHPAPQLSLF